MMQPTSYMPNRLLNCGTARKGAVTCGAASDAQHLPCEHVLRKTLREMGMPRSGRGRGNCPKSAD